MGDRISRLGTRMDGQLREVRQEIRDTRSELKSDILAMEGRLLEAIRALSPSVG